MKNKAVLISTHAVYTQKNIPLYGSGSSIIPFLEKKGKKYLLIQHPIIGNFNAVYQTNIEGNIKLKLNNRLPNILPLNTIQEFFNILKLINKNKTKFGLYIGIDPLNGFYGLILKRFFLVNKVIFYTADYADKRFSNPILNFFYHLIDRVVVKNADCVWNVSTRIMQVRKKQGINSNKNVLIPNSPIFNKTLLKSKWNRYQLIYVSSSPKSTNIQLVFSTITKLSTKYPMLKLIIIGKENWYKLFEKDIVHYQIQDKIIFKSYMPHDELLSLLCKSGIGIGLYTNKTSWTYYSDPMKIRDYLSCGMAVITTNSIATADEIRKYKAGFVIKPNKKELYTVLDKLFADESLHYEIRLNAFKLAEKYDIDKILTKHLLPNI